MAEYVGSGPYYPSTNLAGVGASNKAFKNAVGSGTSAITTTSGTASWYLFNPGASVSTAPTGGTGASPSPTTGNDKGFNFTVADFDATAAAPGGLPAQRVAVSGVVTVNMPITFSGITAANSFAALFYRRTAAGVLTFLASGVSASVLATAATISFTVTLPKTVFAAGESLHVEYWTLTTDVVTGVSHQMITFTTDASATLTGLSLRYDYPRSTSSTTTASAARQLAVGANRSATTTASASRLIRVGVSRAASITGNALNSLNVKPLPQQASISVAEADAFKIILTPKSGSISVSATRKSVIGVFRSPSFSVTAVLSKSITKNLAASITATPALAKFLNLSRSLSATASASALVVIGIPQVVLNRITSGGTTVIKKIINVIFDD